MPGLALHANAGCQCAHAASAAILPSQPRVLVSGQSVATMASKIVVAGCTFQTPCTTIRWLMPSTRVMIDGVPAMVLPAPGPTPGPGPALCLSAAQVPQGPPIVSAVQPRVTAT